MTGGATLPISPYRRIWLYALVGLIYLFLLLPLIVVVVMSFSGDQTLQFPPQSWSFRWYGDLWSSPQWRLPLFMSLKVAFATVVVVTPMSVAAGYSIIKLGHRGRHLRTFLLLPQIVPVVLLAVGIYFVYARLGLLNTTVGIILAHCMFTLPFALVPMLSAFETFDFSQEDAARSLGSTRAAAFFLVTLPQLKGAVIVSALFALAASLEEVVIGILISDGASTLLSKRIFLSLRDQVQPTVASVSTILVVTTILIAILASILQKSRSGNQGV